MPHNKLTIIDTHPATAAILAILDEQARGWNEGDAALYAKAFAEQGCFTNIFGMFLKGHTEFLRKHEMILNNVFKNAVFEYKLVKLDFIGEQVATAETLISISRFNKSGAFNQIYTDANGRLHTRLLQVFEKQADGWKIVCYHNVDVKEGIAVPEL